MKQVKIGWRTSALLAGLAALPVVAWAQSATQDVTLTASVPRYCGFTGSPAISNAANISGVSHAAGSSVVEITSPTTSDGFLNGFGFKFRVNAICNHPSQLTLVTLGGGLKDATPEAVVSGSFLNRIDYNALATWADAPQVSISTTGAAGASSGPQLQATAAIGQIEISVSHVPNLSAPVLAGVYSDTLRVVVAPQ